MVGSSQREPFQSMSEIQNRVYTQPASQMQQMGQAKILSQPMTYMSSNQNNYVNP